MQIINSNFLRRGLVGHWSYAGNGSVSTGGSLPGRSGNGYTGTCTGGTVVNSSGIVLDGTGAVTMGNIYNDILVGTAAKYTIAMWVKASSGRALFSKFGDSSVGGNYRQQWFDAAYKSMGFCGALTGSPYMTYYMTTSILDSTWHHLVITVDFTQDTGEKVKFFLDGVDDTASYSGDITTVQESAAYFAIGAMVGPTGTENVRLTGTVDDFRVYNRVLSAAEILQLYYTTKGRQQ